MIDYKQLRERFSDLNIFVIGDIILDKYIIGDVDRISPEAPVPVLLKKKEEYRLGGAANVAANCRSLCANVTLFGTLGDDDRDEERIKFLLYSLGIKYKLKIAPDDGIKKTRIVCNNHQICRIDEEGSRENYEYDGADLLDLFGMEDGLILSDYNKGTLTNNLWGKILRNGDIERSFVALSPKDRNLLPCNYQFDLLTYNDKEAKHLSENFNYKNRIITKGENGLIYESADCSGKVEAIKKEVIDVSGAGDTVLAASTLGLIAGLSLQEAAEFANQCASYVVSKFGTSVVTWADFGL